MDEIPEGFVAHSRKSPLTDPWEPLYARSMPDRLVLGEGGFISIIVAVDSATGKAVTATDTQRDIVANAKCEECHIKLGGVPGLSGSADSAALSFADLTLDPVTREVTRGTRSISLTRTEFSLLEMLMANPRRVLSRSRILEEVWGYDFPTSGNALEVYVGYLRRKTEADGEPRLIHTVRGVGYVLRETPP